MKTVTILGTITAVFVIASMANPAPVPEPPGRAVVTIAPTSLIFNTPRVRVTSDRDEPVDVGYLILESGQLGELGSVPGLATSTFAIPEGVSIQLVVQPVGRLSVPFVSEPVWADSKTDVAIRVSEHIDRSTVSLGELNVVTVR